MFEKKQEQNNNSIFMIIIIVLLLIIAVLAFFVGKNYNTIFGGSQGENIAGNSEKTTQTNTQGNFDALSVEIIGDARNAEISVDQLEQQLAQQPSMRNIEFVKKDFSDAGVKAYMEENGIQYLPAVIFSTKNFDNSLDPQNLKVYLQELQDGRYSLELGAEYDPFSINERGFSVVEGDVLEDSYIKGDKNATVSMLEYTDVQCPYCIQLHQSTYLDDILAAFPTDVNYVMKHFPLESIHPQAKPGAELLECFADQKGEEAFFELEEIVFAAGDSTKDFIIDEAVKLGADKEMLESCLSESKFASKVETEMANGTARFKVSGTPTVIFYNKETGEWVKASRNITKDKETIEKLLGK